MNNEVQPSENADDEEVSRISEDYQVGKDDAEEIRDLADELGIDEDEAYEIWDEGV